MCLIQLPGSDSQNSVQIRVRTQPEANLITACLLSVIVFLDLKDQGRVRRKEFIPSEYDWTLSCFTQLWDAMRSVKGPLEGYLSEQCLLVILKTLCSILPLINFAKNDVLNVVRTAALLSQITASALILKPAHLAGDLEKALCFSLFDLAVLSKKSHIISEVYDETLLPILVEKTEDNHRISAFGVDLQVRQNPLVLKHSN